MPTTVTVRVHDGSSWNTLSNVRNIRVSRGIGVGNASFEITDATTGQTKLARTGRECDLAYSVDGVSKSFGGFIDRSVIRAGAPGRYNIQVKLIDLTQGAKWHEVIDLYSEAGTKYTDSIKDFWGISWNAVERNSGVQDNALTHADRWYPGYDMLTNLTNELVSHLPNWVWWVGHNGTDANGILKKLYVQPGGYNDLTGSVLLQESDFRLDSIEPFIDPRSDIRVVGVDDPLGDPFRPVSVSTNDAVSRSAYGIRDMVVKAEELVEVTDLQNLAVSILEERKFDRWRGRFTFYNWTLEPGDKVLLYLPDLGINNGGSGVPWILEQVEESINRGRASRAGVFIEHNDAAFVRLVS